MHKHTTMYSCIYTWENERGRGKKEGASWPRGQNQIFTKISAFNYNEQDIFLGWYL